MAFRFVDPDNVWGEYGSRGRGLRWTDSGLARLAHTLGVIVGVKMGGDEEKAASLAEDFVKHLDHLSGWGGERVLIDWFYGKRMPDDYERVPGDLTVSVPPVIVQISDDGTFGGFGLAWYSLVDNATGRDLESRPGVKVFKDDGLYGNIYYQYSMNGGLLFHGFDHGSGDAPTFAVTIGDCRAWSIHT